MVVYIKGGKLEMNKTLEFIKSILIPLILGGIVGLIISNFMDYNVINKPPLSPSGILFPIIWSILYILMGISYGILKNNNLVDEKVKSVYYTQLLTNVTWPIIFFAFKWRFIAIIWILVLLILIIYMTIMFYKKKRIAGLLQIPYIIWTIFATYLTIGVYVLNR